MEEDIPYIQLDLDVEDVRILYSAVNKHLEVWAGGKARRSGEFSQNEVLLISGLDRI